MVGWHLKLKFHHKTSTKSDWDKSRFYVCQPSISEDTFFFVGDTGVHYSTSFENGMAITTFTGFVITSGNQITGADSFLDLFGFGVELVTPYDFVPHIWTHTYEIPDGWQ